MQLKSKRRRCTDAFSLTESMISVAIFALVIGGVYSSLVMQYATVRLNTENLRATQILTDKMEVLRLVSWTQLTNATFMPATFVCPFNYSTNSSDYGLNYRGSVTVSALPLSESYASNLMMVTVSVTWTNANVARTRSVSTLISQYGMQNSLY